MNANLQTLSYFIPDMKTSVEQKLQAVQGIAEMNILLGILSIIFSELGNIVSRQESEERIKQLEKRLSEIEKKVFPSTEL